MILSKSIENGLMKFSIEFDESTIFSEKDIKDALKLLQRLQEQLRNIIIAGNINA